MRKLNFFLTLLIFSFIFSYSINALYNKKEIKSISNSALVSIILMNNINMDFMYNESDSFTEHSEYDDENIYDDPAALIIDTVLETDEEGFNSKIEINIDLNSSANYLKNEILKNSNKLFPFEIIPEEEVISRKELYNLPNPGDVFVPDGYPSINSINRKAVIESLKVLSDTDSIILIQAGFSFDVFKQLNGDGWGKVSCNITVEIFNQKGKKIISYVSNGTSEKDIHFNYGSPFPKEEIDPLTIEAAKNAYLKMERWFVKQKR